MGKGTTAILHLPVPGTCLAVRNSTARVLRRIGYRTWTAGTRAEAVRLYGEHTGRISLVLLVMAMPLRGGEQTLREQLRLDGDVRVIVVSGDSSDGNAEALLALGTLPFITKPNDRRALIEAVSAA